MVLAFSIEGVLTVIMIPFVRMVLDSIPADMVGRLSQQLPINDKNQEYLDVARAETFHSHAMQLLYLAQLGRPDILEAHR
jgi:hypothetical protein